MRKKKSFLNLCLVKEKEEDEESDDSECSDGWEKVKRKRKRKRKDSKDCKEKERRREKGKSRKGNVEERFEKENEERQGCFEKERKDGKENEGKKEGVMCNNTIKRISFDVNIRVVNGDGSVVTKSDNFSDKINIRKLMEEKEKLESQMDVVVAEADEKIKNLMFNLDVIRNENNSLKVMLDDMKQMVKDREAEINRLKNVNPGAAGTVMRSVEQQTEVEVTLLAINMEQMNRIKQKYEVIADTTLRTNIELTGKINECEKYKAYIIKLENEVLTLKKRNDGLQDNIITKLDTGKAMAVTVDTLNKRIKELEGIIKKKDKLIRQLQSSDAPRKWGSGNGSGLGQGANRGQSPRAPKGPILKNKDQLGKEVEVMKEVMPEVVTNNMKDAELRSLEESRAGDVRSSVTMMLKKNLNLERRITEDQEKMKRNKEVVARTEKYLGSGGR